MKVLFFSCLLLTLVACQAPSPTAEVDTTTSIPLAGKRVLILGNSITQNGTWVSYLEYYLRIAYPDATFDIISIGLSSETASCLTEPVHPYPRPCISERLYRALKHVKPQIVMACYGMNDGIYHPPSWERMAAYQQGIYDLQAEVKAIGADLILLTPPPFDPVPIAEKVVPIDAPLFGYATPYAGYDEVLGEYAEWLNSLADSTLITIDLHTAINAYVENKRTQDPTFTLAQDGVHPAPEGHALMARTILEALQVPIADQIEEGLFEKVAERRKIRSEGWLPYVGYIKGDTVFTESIEQIELQVGELESAISEYQHP